MRKIVPNGGMFRFGDEYLYYGKYTTAAMFMTRHILR